MLVTDVDRLAYSFIRAYGLLLWNMLWPLAFGFLLSAWIRTRVPAAVVTRHMGKNTLSGGIIALVFGVVSSVCNYAVVGMGGTLRAKGASWPNVLVYMIASTSLGITMIITIYGFMGHTMLLLQVCMTIVFMVLAYFLAMLYRLPAPEDTAVRASSGQGRQGVWIETAVHFYDDIVMTRRDILVGMAVASAVGVFVPDAWWKVVFFQDSSLPVLTWIWNALIGIIIAILTFGCSVGNVALAAVMWWNGVTPGGVIAFLVASLLTVPMLQLYVKMYSTGVMLRLIGVNVTGILIAALIMDAVLATQGIAFDRPATSLMSGHMSDVRLALNSIFGIAGLVFFFVGKGHSAMASMSDMSMSDMALMGVKKARGMEMDMAGMKGMKGMEGMPGMKDMPDMKDMPGMENMSGMKGMSGMKDMPGMEGMKDAHMSGMHGGEHPYMAEGNAMPDMHGNAAGMPEHGMKGMAMPMREGESVAGDAAAAPATGETPPRKG